MSKMRAAKAQVAAGHFWIMIASVFTSQFVIFGVVPATYPVLMKGLMATSAALGIVAYQLGVRWQAPPQAQPAVPPPLPPPPTPVPPPFQKGD